MLRLNDRLKHFIAGAWVGAVAVVGTALIWWGLSAPPPQEVHTRIAGGDHIVFVVIAAALPNENYVASVEAAKKVTKEYASTCRCYFSTVGVATQPDPNVAARVLDAYGVFDEMSLGRSWFNSGLKRFTTDIGASTDSPQVVVLRESVVIVNRRWWRSTRLLELARLVGPGQLDAWASEGYPLESDSARVIHESDPVISEGT